MIGIEHLAGRPPRMLRGRPLPGYMIDPYVIATAAAITAAIVVALQISLPAAAVTASLIAGWSSAWSP